MPDGYAAGRAGPCDLPGNSQSGRQPVRQTASQADSFTTIMPRRYSRGHVIDPAEAQETEYRKLNHRKLKHRKPKHRRPDTGVLL